MINWTLNKTRKEILNNSSRYKVLVCGRRWGKTILSLMYLMKDKFNPNEMVDVVDPITGDSVSYIKTDVCRV